MPRDAVSPPSPPNNWECYLQNDGKAAGMHINEQSDMPHESVAPTPPLPQHGDSLQNDDKATGMHINEHSNMPHESESPATPPTHPEVELHVGTNNEEESVSYVTIVGQGRRQRLGKDQDRYDFTAPLKTQIGGAPAESGTGRYCKFIFFTEPFKGFKIIFRWDCSCYEFGFFVNRFEIENLKS